MKLHSTLLAVVVFSPLTLLAQVFLAQSAQAALLAGDLTTSGDGLITKDSLTGLEWLDLTLTQGISFDAVAAGFGGYTTEKGFRFANAAEVNALSTSALEGKIGDFTSTPFLSNQISAAYFAAKEINTLLGVTQNLSQRSEILSSIGYIAPVSATGTVAFLGISSNLTTNQTSQVRQTRGDAQGFGGRTPSSLSSSVTGSYLVRNSAPVKSTPEPSALLGCAIVLTGLLKPRSAKSSG
jgi:hypothetical protein